MLFMYTIVLGFLIGFGITTYFYYKDYGFEFDMIVEGVFVGVIGGLIGLILAAALPVKYKKSRWSEKLVSLKDNSSVNGSFFLGCGQINGSMKYVYYQQNADSTYKMWECDYNKAAIKYTNTEPRVVIDDYRPSNSIWNKFAIDILSESDQRYIFEIPKGSIKNSYELDSQ